MRTASKRKNEGRKIKTKNELCVVYRDELGAVLVRTDNTGIQFLNDECIFSTEDEIYRIKIQDLVSIFMD